MSTEVDALVYLRRLVIDMIRFFHVEYVFLVDLSRHLSPEEVREGLA